MYDQNERGAAAASSTCTPTIVPAGARRHSKLADLPNRPPPLAEGDVDFDAEESACVFSNETAGADDDVNGDNVLGVGIVRDAGDMFRWEPAYHPKTAAFAAFVAAYDPPVEHVPEPVAARAAALDRNEGYARRPRRSATRIPRGRGRTASAIATTWPRPRPRR